MATKKREAQKAANTRNLAFVGRQKDKGLMRFNRWVTPAEADVLKAAYEKLVKKRGAS